MQELENTARELVAPGKGILAADESLGSIEKRFKSVGVSSTEENRRAYRDLLCSAPGLGEFISGVILFDETIRQKAADGTPLAEVLRRQGVIPGIKVDKGAKALANFPGEKVTEGLDGLRERLAEYARLGARFTKWRAVLAIGEGIPTDFCIDANAHALARFAALSQEAGLVPIVEPETLMDGAHSMERHAEATERAVKAVFRALSQHRVNVKAALLKPNMCLPGTESQQSVSAQQTAETTLNCLRRSVPGNLPGVVFLSGGQGDIEATERLNAMNQLGGAPWELSFSFGRALQAPALQAWAGRSENIASAQSALLHRARCNSAARRGQYSPAMEQGTGR